MPRSYDDWLSDEGDYLRHLQACAGPYNDADDRPSGGELEQGLEAIAGTAEVTATMRPDGISGAAKENP